MALDAVSQQVTIAHLEVRQGRRQVDLAVENVDQSLNSLDLNMQRIHAAEGLPIEAMQAMRAAAEAQETYLESVSAFNRAQFRLLRAVGRSPERGVLAGPPLGVDAGDE
jgi:outer membrane protein TolC